MKYINNFLNESKNNELFTSLLKYQNFFDESGLNNFIEYDNKIENILNSFDEKIIQFVIETIIYTWYNVSSYDTFKSDVKEFLKKSKILKSDLDSAFIKVFDELELN